MTYSTKSTNLPLRKRTWVRRVGFVSLAILWVLVCLRVGTWV